LTKITDDGDAREMCVMVHVAVKDLYRDQCATLYMC